MEKKSEKSRIHNEELVESFKNNKSSNDCSSCDESTLISSITSDEIPIITNIAYLINEPCCPTSNTTKDQSNTRFGKDEVLLSSVFLSKKFRASFDKLSGHDNSIIFDEKVIYKKTKQGEIEFYHWINNTYISSTLKLMLNFIPKFYGIKENPLDCSKMIILENLLDNCENPNIMDCKLGRITWAKEDSEKKKEKRKLINKYSTTDILGFRLTGILVRDKNGNILKKEIKRAIESKIKSEDQIIKYFQMFISSNVDIDKNYNDDIILNNTNNNSDIRNAHEKSNSCNSEYFFNKNIVEEIKNQIQNILNFFRSQYEKTFISSSLVFVLGKNNTLKVKLIDFAHVYDSEEKLDGNVIEGLENILKIWSAIYNK